MTKLWINQESVLKMIRKSQKAVGGILLCVSANCWKREVRSKHFTLNLSVSVYILWAVTIVSSTESVDFYVCVLHYKLCSLKMIF